MRHVPRRPVVDDHSDDEQPFPWIPVVAPLVTACVLWIATGSPLSLLFGVMSPVMLVAQFLETRRNSRRRAVRQAEHLARAHDEESAKEELEHRRRVEQAASEHPPADAFRSLIAVARLPNERREFSTAVDSSPIGSARPHVVRLGIGADGLPVCVDARSGISFHGSASARRAVIRAATAQLWWVTGDVRTHVVSPETHSDGVHSVPFREDARWLVSVESDDVAHVVDRDAPARVPRVMTPDRLSTHDLVALRHDIGQRDNMRREREREPSRAPATSQARGFDVTVGETREGDPVVLNIVNHGPHLAISGMTGSGKTSFLVGWLSTLAAQCDHTTLELAVIDFKGGIDFAPLAHLTNCVGFATDLDEGAIERALVGLEAEVTRRERHLRSGVSVDDLARLIVVFDEFRATAAAHPRATSIVVDLTARGRALGIHVVLSTQRASTSISEEILANVPLRVAFRSLTPHESVYMVGDSSAHRDVVHPGDGVISFAHARSTVVRMHRVTSSVEAVSQRADSRRVWTEPLPVKVLSDDIAQHPPFDGKNDLAAPAHDDSRGDRGVCIGIVDAPRRQRWESGWYHPRRDGHMVITGTARTGRSTAIHAMAVALDAMHSPTLLINNEIALWDWFDPRCRDRAANRLGTGQLETVVLIDGLEQILSHLTPDARDTLSDWLLQALRTTDAARYIVSCDSESAWATRLPPLCAQRIDLISAEQPGRAAWRKHAIQLPFVALARQVASERTPDTATSHIESLLAAHPPVVAVIGRHVNESDRWRHSAQTLLPQFASATTEAWLARLGEFAASTADSAILVSGQLSTSDARMLLRGRAPVPPMSLDESILLLPDGTYCRLA